MIALLLDSSEKNLTVGISKDGVLLASVSEIAWMRQSELMVERIDSLLSECGLTSNDLGCVACSKGPGSYTGVRIALTIAKTVSMAKKIPLYLTSSLEVLQDFGKPSICLSNARGKRSYVAIYEKGNAILQDCIKDNDEVLSLIASHPECAVCGDVAYLGLASEKSEIAKNMSLLLDEAHRCEEPLGAKPVYLKDDYGTSDFKVVVRKMIPSDLSAVMAIEKEAFHHPYTEQQMLYELLENPVSSIYCAVVDAEVVGFIDFMITFNSSTINQIAVKESFRSKGIGNRLLGQMLKDCDSKEDPVDYLTLEVRASNVRAQKFYKKHKFDAIVTKKAYYEDGEDAIYMVRSIAHA